MSKQEDGVWRQGNPYLNLRESEFPYQIPREEVDYVLETSDRVVGGVNS